LLPCALAVYLALAMAHLDLPGLYYDEALDAVPAMQFTLGQTLDDFAAVRLAGREWPLTVMPYVGATTTYLLIPVFMLFGPGLAPLRLTLIALGALTLLLAWAVVRKLFDARIAGLAALLLAVSPAYVFWSRMGAFISLPLVPLSLGLLWALYQWRETEKARYLSVAAFCLGLGLTTKILFVWLIPALGLAWILLAPTRDDGRRDWFGPLRRVRPGAAAAAALAGLVGLAPFLVYNALHAGETLRLLQRNLTETELYGVSNLDLLANLRIVFAKDLPELLDGAWFANALGGLERSALVLPALGLALLVIAALAWTRRLVAPRRVALLLVLIAAITAQSSITVSSLGATHLAILWPWPQTLIAVSAVGLLDLSLERGRLRWPALALAGLLTLAPLASDLRTVLAYHGRLEQTGGRGYFSDAIYALGADLDRPDAPQAVALDWGFKRNLQLLTENRVIPEDGFTYSQRPGEEYRRWAEWRLDQGEALYIENTPPYTAFGGHAELLEEAAYRTGRALTLWREYTQRDGEPVYRVYSVSDAPPILALPANAVSLPARFGDEIALLGHDPLGEVWTAGERVVFHIYWRAESQPQDSYKVFGHLAAPDERVVAQHDGVPVLWAYPTGAWQEGEIVADRIVLALPADLPEGVYRLWLGLYGEADGERLAAYHGDARLADDRLLLGEITIAH
jgi:hypothetical protein